MEDKLHGRQPDGSLVFLVHFDPETGWISLSFAERLCRLNLTTRQAVQLAESLLRLTVETADLSKPPKVRVNKADNFRE